MDVATAFESEIAWYESDGAQLPTFTKHTIMPNTLATGIDDVADLDGDGDLDLILAAGGGVSWFENNGADPPEFTLHRASSAPNRPLDAITADIDGDGDLDIVTGDWGGFVSNRVFWLKNMGGTPPTFTHHVIATESYRITAVSRADFDGDGDIDVLATGPGLPNAAGKLKWYENLSPKKNSANREIWPLFD